MDVIFAYTREDAINDGVLVDVSETAREAGFRIPVAVTRAVWDGYVQTDSELERLGQSVQGRLWDVLWMCALKARSSGNMDTIHFRLHVRYGPQERDIALVTLKAVCGPGDDGDPVITIMEPSED